MITFLSASKRSRQKAQTVTSTFDCFSPQIGLIIVIKEVGLKGNKQRIRLDSNSLIIARKIALVL